MFTGGVDFFTTTGAADPPYAVENFKLESTNFESGVPIMVWRSVGNSHTEFARESAIDELAIAVGRDPVDLRRELLTGSPRTLRVLDLAAEIADWGTPSPEGRARGITCSSFLSHSANVTEISLDGRERVHVDRIVFVLDCGITINPDLVRAQVEGGLLFGLSAAAWARSCSATAGRSSPRTSTAIRLSGCARFPSSRCTWSTRPSRRRASARSASHPLHQPWRTQSQPSPAPESGSSPSPRP